MATPRPTYRSHLDGSNCGHRHRLYREARDCGYKREDMVGYFRAPSHVVDRAGRLVDQEEGASLDMVHEHEAMIARQAVRQGEIQALQAEIRTTRGRG